MAKRKYRLLARAQMGGAVVEPGHVFELEDGELGPHKTVINRHDVIDVHNDSTRRAPAAADVPLYEPYGHSGFVGDPVVIGLDPGVGDEGVTYHVPVPGAPHDGRPNEPADPPADQEHSADNDTA